MNLDKGVDVIVVVVDFRPTNALALPGVLRIRFGDEFLDLFEYNPWKIFVQDVMIAITRNN